MHVWVGAIASLEWRFILVCGVILGCARVVVSLFSKKPCNGRADLISGFLMLSIFLGAVVVWSRARFVEIGMVLSVGYVFEGLVTLIRERRNPVTAFTNL